MAENPITKINNDYFGEVREKRYLMEVYRDCLEKLITCGVVNELYIIKRKSKEHDHTGQGLCQSCIGMGVIRDSMFDALVLSLRLLFSENHKRLARDFLKAVAKLDRRDFESYFKQKYDYQISNKELDDVSIIASKSNDAKKNINSVYVEHLNPYQSNVFHQSNNGLHYDVKHTEGEFFGMKSNMYTRSVKFERNLKPYRNMLGELASVIHDFTRYTTSSKFFREIYIDQYISDCIDLFSISIDEVAKENMRDLIKSSLEDHLHVLVCGDGMAKHNYLAGLRIQKLQNERDAKKAS